MDLARGHACRASGCGEAAEPLFYRAIFRNSPLGAFPKGVPLMANKLTKKQIEHLQQRLLRERDRALRSLGQFDELAKQQAESADSDQYSYSDHIADLGTDSMEREKALLFASKEGRYLYRVEDALRRLYKDPAAFGKCHGCGKLIDFERLDALPHARYCIECKLKEEAA